MKLLTVVGARPQFIKAASVEYAIRDAVAAGTRIVPFLLHTGQHYDFEMSRVFFEELGLRTPDRNLDVGSGSHGSQTARMLEGIEATLIEEEPDVVLVYGDTNSTLAGALAASKLKIPIAHVEAGLRSYNRAMPEEINRIVTDHLSDWLFCPTPEIAKTLRGEGIERGVRVVGDVMYEMVLRFGSNPALPAGWSDLGLRRGRYVLVTVHRAENTDQPSKLREIVAALDELARTLPVVLPMHPRTRKAIEAAAIDLPPAVHVVAPLSYSEMIAAESAAGVVLTDSGGVQKEAYWLGTPCVTIRTETEWVETLEDSRNVLCATRATAIIECAFRQIEKGRLVRPPVALATASTDIVGTLARELAPDTPRV